MTSLIGCNTLYAPDAPEDCSLQATLAALDKVKAVGYAATEYSHCQGFNLEEAREIGAHAMEIGLLNWSCHASFHAPGAMDSPAGYAADLGHTIAVCAALGASVIVVHVPFRLGLLQPQEALLPKDQRAFDLAVLDEAGQGAADLGVELALENGATLKHMDYILELVAHLNQPHVGICIDTGHAALGNLGAAPAVSMAGERLLTTHLQDNWGQVDDHLPPGSGNIDWGAVLGALHDVGYRRPLLLELTDRARHRPYDQDKEMAAGYQYIKQHWSTAG